MKILLLTNGNPHAIGILRKCRESGVNITQVALEAARPPKFVGFGSLFRTFGVSLAKEGVRWRRRLLHELHWFRKLCDEHSNVTRVGALGSEKCARDLYSISPDVIALGGIGILNDSEISSARLGVVNAHPGLLPWARGVDVVGRSALRELPIGATFHRVDRGIDRGPFIMRRLTDLRDVGWDLTSIMSATDDLAIALMTEGLSAINAAGTLVPGVPHRRRWELCLRMNQEERHRAQAAALRGEVHSRQERFRKHLPCDSRLNLPFEWEGDLNL